MDTIAAPPDSLSREQKSLTEAVRPSLRELVVARRRLHLKAVVIGALAVSSYWYLVAGHASVIGQLMAAGVLIVALTAAATCVFHDANHASFSTSRVVNRLAGFTGDLLGASSWIWRFKHNNLHHGNTNMVGFDADIDQAPFARLAPDQPWRPWHRYQHFYMWVLYGFLTLQWFLISDYVDLMNHGIGRQRFARQPRRRDVGMIAVGKLLHASWAIALAAGVSPVVGRADLLPGHLVDRWPVAGDDVPTRPLRRTCRISSVGHSTSRVRTSSPTSFEPRWTCTAARGSAPAALHWLMGGLDFQVEHHLAPRLPHTVYPLVARRLNRACNACELTVKSHATPWRAIRSHARWLKAMGTRP